MVSYLFSCDYATCAVPEAHRELFFDSEDVVASTEGWEPGSLNLAQAFAMKFRTPLVHGDVTRLLIDLGKSADDRWSRFALKLPETTRAKLVDRHEKPYLAMLEQRVAEDFKRKAAVIHVLIHTSDAHEGRIVLETPQTAELAETVAMEWRNRLARADFDARLHRQSGGSAPTEYLSKRFPNTQYGQIRLTVSQSFFLEGRPKKWEVLKKHAIETLAQSVAETVVVSDQEFPVTDPG